MENKLKIWLVLEGPTHIDELPLEEQASDPNCNFRVLCKVEQDGEIREDFFWFDDENGANDWIKHFQQKIEPVEISEDTK